MKMGKPLKNLDFLLLLSLLSFCISIDSVHGLYCYVCSSDKLEECSTLHSTEELPLELCPSDIASCFTRIENGVTIRGCLPHRKQTLCSTDSCTFCRSNKCNSQIFPEDRLSCLHCAGSSCVNQSNTIDVRYPCANYVEDDECYSIFSYDGSTAYRGCMSDYPNPNKDFCLDHYAQCTRCKKRACNSDHVQFEKKISCVKCTPDENSNCNVVDESTTSIECAPTTLGYTNLCYIFQNGSVSHRGCLYEAPGEIFSECNDIFSEACFTCNQTDCNRAPVVNENLALNPFHYEVVRNEGKSELVQCDDPKCTKLSPWERFCYKCDSRTNPNCTNELDKSMIGICDFEREDLGCYHMITESGVVRGCVKDLEGEMKEKCMANDDSCKICFERDCNARVNFSECLVTDEDQSKAWNNFESLSSPKICRNYDEQCFVQVIKEDTVIRGCLDTYAAQNDLPLNFLASVENNKTYRICSGHLCNDEEIKPLYCQSCNSTEKNCIDDPMHLYFRKRCKPLEVSQAGCYHFDNGSYVERGCISHLEETQRTECESNSDTCKKCYGNECNSKKKFLKCVWSLNDNVSRLEKRCRAYNDECFILAKNGAVRRGCMSDLIYKPEPGIDIMVDRRNLDIYERCLSDNCNSRELESEHCIVCSSDVDGNNQCMYNPTTNMRQKCPMRVKKLGCYLEQNSIWKRGCVSQLTHEVRYECRSLNGTCKICHGDSCNKRRSFQVCKTCSSEDDEHCISKPYMNKETTCPNYLDECYIHVKDGIVKRNCIGDDFMNSLEECDNSEDCMHCTGYKCNAKEIHPEVCFGCDSYKNATCKTLSFFEEQYFTQECPISVREQGCYHFIDKKDERHLRGCVSQLSNEEKQRYQERTDEFKTCIEPKCNQQRHFEQCLVCNSTENPDCATDPSTSYIKVCDNYKNVCFTRILPRSVIRDCLNDIKEAQRIQCSYDSERCKTCITKDGIGCNNITVDMDACIECDSSEDESCRLIPKEIDQRICAHLNAPTRKGCYLSIVGDHVKRGCIQDLTPSEGNECLNGTKTCKSCDWSNCNTKQAFQECYNCNSKDDARCARGAQSANTEICKTYYSECITGIDHQGYTHRGCSTHYRDVLHQYDNCEENKCNDKIFPDNRLKCYQCNGDDNCNFVSPNSTDIDLQPQPCGISSDFDQCFTYINKEKKMFRGCLSDSTPIRLECELDGENKQGTCVKCTGSGCNNQPKVKRAELSCAKCSDMKECAFSQSSSSAITCLNDVAFGDDESCFVYTLPGSNTVERGCTLDVNATDTNWCQETKGCEKCFAKGCNTQNVRFSWCLRCVSDTTGNCAKVSNPNEYIEQCDHLPYPYSKRGCYTNIKDGIITRGCNIDLSEDQYENCWKDDSCTLCQDDYCNKEDVNSSLKTSANTLMCIFTLMITYISQIHCLKYQ